MIVNVLKESGREEALLGLSLSFYDHQEPLDDWWDINKSVRAERRGGALAFKGGGHNKFLASIGVWLYIQAPRCWWSEFDTYKVGVTANSSSTMHTLDKRLTTPDDYEVGTSFLSVRAFNACIEEYKNPESEHYKDISRLKCNLPEGWLQERQVSTNYMSLQNIIRQRANHRLTYWSTFIDAVLDQVEHPELLRESI
jgi:hypothetical protein